MSSDWIPVAVLFSVIFAIVGVLTIIIRGTFKGNITRAVASVLGLFAGVSGASHGLGETLQGNAAPSGIMIKAWPNLTLLDGEPALTVLPSFLVAGVLAIVFGFIVATWAAWFVQRRNGGLVLILLSIVMLLVGGGIFPPVFGVIAGMVGTRIKLVQPWRSGNKQMRTRSGQIGVLGSNPTRSTRSNGTVLAPPVAPERPEGPCRDRGATFHSPGHEPRF